jgi:glycosyltransferase involved in cell wall biosynthesis
MPVFNSRQWLEESVGSILGQTFGDFELIISDNASTDDTFAVCERLAARDTRIILLRNASNLGANHNYLATLAAARGQYFKWASSNDLCAPTFIDRCVQALDADPRAVLVCPGTALFESSIEDAQPYDRDTELLDASAAARFVQLFNSMALNNAMNGLMRRAALNEVARMGSFTGADIVFMAELALKGKFLLHRETLFFRRMSRETATKLKSAREAERHLVPDARGPLTWQHWRFHLAMLRAARSAPFFSRDWFRIVDYSLRALVWSRRALAEDAVHALRQAMS